MAKQQLTNPFKNKPIAILGDVMVDRFIYGSVERISPEAPVPVVHVTGRKTMLGGAGNVVANLAKLGATPLLVGRLGDDDFGQAFRTIAGGMDVDLSTMLTTSSPTISKTRIIARSQQVVRFDEEDKTPLGADEHTAIDALLRCVREKSDVIVVSDYDKGMVDETTMALVKELWADGTILVDPKPKRAHTYRGVSGMTPNLQESAQLLGEDETAKTDDDAYQVAARLCEVFEMAFVLLTRSGDGMTLYEKGGDVSHLHVKAQEVIDVSGAGDTVISVLAAALKAGLDVKEATHMANVAAGLVVAKLGTATLTWDELAAGLSAQKA